MLRVLVIGVGAHIFSAAHAPALEAIGAEVAGVFDTDAEAVRTIARERAWVAYGSLDELLAVPADVAVITAPHPAHASLALACLDAGVDVLLEKPVAVTVGEADAIVERAAETGRVVAVAFQHRLRREVIRAKELVDAGGIGELHRAEVVSYYPKRSVYYAGSDWRGTWVGEGGGVVLNQGQHDLDLLTYLSGQPDEVFAWLSSRVQPTETEDTAEAVVRWPSGATGSIHISSAASGGPQRLELVGSRGVLRVLHGELHLVESEVDVREFAAADGDPFDRPGTIVHPAEAGGGGTHEEVYRDLAESLTTGREPCAPVARALAALELTNAMTLSSHTGEVVRLPLDRDAYGVVYEHYCMQKRRWWPN